MPFIAGLDGSLVALMDKANKIKQELWSGVEAELRGESQIWAWHSSTLACILPNFWAEQQQSIQEPLVKIYYVLYIVR